MANEKQQLKERNCAICGKRFVFRDEWVFRKKEKIFCSWGCMRKFERTSPAMTSADRRRKIQQAIADGLTVMEIARLLGEDSGLISYYVRKAKEKKGESA